WWRSSAQIVQSATPKKNHMIMRKRVFPSTGSSTHLTTLSRSWSSKAKPIAHLENSAAANVHSRSCSTASAWLSTRCSTRN
ncbi:MAG: putative protein, partial [uncultured Chloroflexia bacterium]